MNSFWRITKGEKFITFFVAEVDTKNKSVTYVNAGHYPPLLIAENGDTRRLTSGSTVLGVFDVQVYFWAVKGSVSVFWRILELLVF